MSGSINNEEDVMDLLSVSDNFEITREEEKSLLEDDSMAVDSPLKNNTTSSTNETSNVRKAIIYDLSEEEDENDDQSRDKFRSERQKITYSFNESNRPKIPDSLGGRLSSKSKNKRQRDYSPIFSQNNRIRKRNRRNRNRDHSSYDNQRGDLRQLINAVKQHNSFNERQNAMKQTLGLPPLLDYQMKLGILNPIVATAAAQNQLLVNALFAQNSVNPILSRLSTTPQIPLVSSVIPTVQKPKDNFQITVVNEQKVRPQPTLSNITQTRTQIQCRVSNMDSTDSTDNEVNNAIPSTAPSTLRGQSSQKKQLSTLFGKHLSTKTQQTKPIPTKPQTQTIRNSTSLTVAPGVSGTGLFGEALAEVEVGVDNEYLRRMQELEKKRLEIQKRKEERRLQMSDQRLDSALKLKQKIVNQRTY